MNGSLDHGDYDDGAGCEPPCIGMDWGRHIDGGLRDLTAGVALMVAVAVIAVCCFTGAFVIGRWIWELA